MGQTRLSSGLLFLSIILGFLSVASMIVGGYILYQGVISSDGGAVMVSVCALVLAYPIGSMALMALDLHVREEEAYEAYMEKLKKEKLYQKWLEYK
jgi:hypothetical protein